MLGEGRTERRPAYVAQHVEGGRETRGQVGLPSFKDERQYGGPGDCCRERSDAPQAWVQNRGRQEAEGKIAGDIRHDVERGDVPRPGLDQIGERGNPYVSPTGQGIEGRIGDQQDIDEEQDARQRRAARGNGVSALGGAPHGAAASDGRTASRRPCRGTRTPCRRAAAGSALRGRRSPAAPTWLAQVRPQTARRRRWSASSTSRARAARRPTRASPCRRSAPCGRYLHR